jgi:uroporphyrin-III C-methyltransferase
MQPTGFVSLVGAGPGDPELLTVKAVRRLQAAEVVVYDYLANPDLIIHCRQRPLLIYAGKRAGRQSLSQATINQTLIEHGRSGRLVVRLKGGDPFIFGRGGEEAEALTQAGIPWEIVPGISSALAAPAYAGIPLTHRDLASSCTIVTGHEALSSERRIDWRTGLSADTLVILMGMERLATIMQRLIEAGRNAATPAAVVRWGTTAQQQTIVATIATLAEAVACHGLGSPAVIVVGEVVQCATTLNWFVPPASWCPPATDVLELPIPCVAVQP